MILADTDFFVDLMSPRRAHHARARRRAEAFAEADEAVYMSALTRFELYSGSERYVDPPAERRRIQAILDDYPALALTVQAADRAGKIHGLLARDGRAVGAVDALIAAIALEHEVPVLTRNVAEFERVQGLKVQTY